MMHRECRCPAVAIIVYYTMFLLIIYSKYTETNKQYPDIHVLSF